MFEVPGIVVISTPYLRGLRPPRPVPRTSTPGSRAGAQGAQEGGGLVARERRFRPVLLVLVGHGGESSGATTAELVGLTAHNRQS